MSQTLENHVPRAVIDAGSRWQGWLQVAGLAVLLGTLFHRVFAQLAVQWWTDANVSHGSATGDPIQSSCSTAAVPRLPTRQRAAGTRGSACSAGRKRDQSTLSLARRSGSMQWATIALFAHYTFGFLWLRLRVTRLTTPPARPFFASHCRRCKWNPYRRERDSRPVWGPQQSRRILPSALRMVDLCPVFRAAHAVPRDSSADRPACAIEARLMRLASWRRFVPVAVLFAATAALLEARSINETVPPHRNLITFPVSVDAWRGTDLPLSQRELAVLGPGEFLVRELPAHAD